jgi:hypothetical protein
MNAWFRRLLLILTIGGGFVGLVLTTQFFSQANKVIAYIMLLAFVALYGYGILVGLKLSEGPTPLRHLRAYFILQIPLISSPLVAYRFCSGLQATVAMIPPSVGFDFRFGSEWHFAISSSDPWGVGVNLVALAIVVLLYSRLAVPAEEPLSRPNQSLERTADRRDNLLSMTSTAKSEAQLALVRGRSAPSR